MKIAKPSSQKVETAGIEEEQKSFYAKLKKRDISTSVKYACTYSFYTLLENELKRIKSKVGDDAYEKSSVTHRIKKKIIAFHVHHLEKELIGMKVRIGTRKK